MLPIRSEVTHPDPLVVLYREFLETVTFDVLPRECHHIANAETGVSHQQCHRARPSPLVTAPADSATRRDDLHDFVLRVRYYIIRFLQSRGPGRTRRTAARVPRLFSTTSARFATEQTCPSLRHRVGPRRQRNLSCRTRRSNARSVCSGVGFHRRCLRAVREKLTASLIAFRGFPEARSSISVSLRAARWRSRVFRESRTLLPVLVVPHARNKQWPRHLR